MAIFLDSWFPFHSIGQLYLPPQARADMNHPDSHCHTPLHLASDEGHLDVVRSLVASKAAKDGKSKMVMEMGQDGPLPVINGVMGPL